VHQLLSPRRGRLRWLTVFGPAVYLALLALGVLYFHPHPLPPVWPAFFAALGVSVLGTYVFSQFVFSHVRRQEEEIVRQTRALAEATEAMAVMRERQRIARDLHDSIAQTLGYLHLGLAEAERRLGAAGEPAGVRAELAELRKVARDAYAEVREAIFGLRGMVSRSLGFIPTLTEYLHDWSRRTGIGVDLKVSGPDAAALPLIVEVQLIGIVQEAMTNIRKHAGARHVRVSVDRDPDVARVSIQDDGAGFDPPPAGPSVGIETMRERAEAVGGKLMLASRRGHGTTVEVHLPLEVLVRRSA
jgi:signal transduction histidine kinase